MELPSTCHFQGWNIRYSLAAPKAPASNQPAKYAVFPYGTPWSSAVFRPTVDALLAKGSYRILVYDLPGYGQSQGLRSRQQHRDSDCRRRLPGRQLNGKDHPAPAVVAHDIAGSIVLRAHLLHDCDVRSMMLVDTNVVLPWGDGFYTLARSEPHTFMKLPPGIFEAVVSAVIRSACYNPNVLQSGLEDILARPWIGSPSIAQANDADVREMLDGDFYPHVRCDGKVVWGEQDKWIPRERVEELIKRLDGRTKECVFIPEVGHMVMLDQPERFAIEVFEWLARPGSSSS
ncbi:Alpha/Beta hydrolase protein [Bisporella sp. PMI_857]|nr:Alpha/Beta hydrolase protein [Bisporella sp. PMI_857]